MIKIVTIAVIAALLIPGSSVARIHGSIKVQATVEDVRIADNGAPGWSAGDFRSEYLLVWNKAITTRPIGHAFESCVFLGRGGAFRSGFSTCSMTIFLPHGKLRMGGAIHSERRFWIPITGGTGIYQGAGGTMLSIRVGVNVRNLILNLT